MCFVLPNPVLHLESPGFERLRWAGVKPQTSLHPAHGGSCTSPAAGDRGPKARSPERPPHSRSSQRAWGCSRGAGLGGQGSCGGSGWGGVAPTQPLGEPISPAAPRALAEHAARGGALREAGRAPRIHRHDARSFYPPPVGIAGGFVPLPGLWMESWRVKPELRFCLC